jgi:hypothetical protein
MGTTPNGVAPDGAYVFGGGSYRYGQEYSENNVMEMFSVPKAVNSEEARTVMADVLHMAPTGTLNQLQPVLAGSEDEVDFADGDTAVETVMDSLSPKENPFEWITEGWKAIIKVFLPDSTVLTPEEVMAAAAALNGRLTMLEGGGVVTTHTVSGTWTNPSPTEHKAIQVICVNGGDGGARRSSNYHDQAKGGQSGGYMQKTLYTDELPATVAMVMGAPGAGATSGGRGGEGGVTSFGTYVVGMKGVGAIFGDGTFSTGIPPGNGGDGAYYSDSPQFPSTDGQGGPFAPGGRSGFGSTSGTVAGSAGASAPANIPSGGAGGGGGSVGGTLALTGVGGAGGFPGGGGGAGGSTDTAFADGGPGGAPCIYIITPPDPPTLEP